MKKVAIVSAHFVPSNLAAIHRSRLWSEHLHEFGWEPIIVTTHWDFYEENPEFELMELVREDLRIVRTNAFPTRPVRIVGDIGIRAFPWHLAALRNLCGTEKIDFVHVTIPSHFSAPLGRFVKQKTGTPYGIDYIDPWVHDFPGSDWPLTKAWVSARLARWLEPWAVARASLITGINRRYYQGVLDRNPELQKRTVLAEMPYGGSEKDHEHVRRNPRTAKLLENHQRKFNLIYAGAMLPKAYDVLDRLLQALVLLRERHPTLPEEFHLLFVGTGKAPDDPGGFNIRPRVERHGLQDCVTEYPQRLPYLDVLSHLHASSGVLVLGSSERHYSPSKIFQSVMSRRPVFALLHEQSTALPILAATGASQIITLSEKLLPSAPVLAMELEKFIYSNGYSTNKVCWGALEKYSARNSAKVLASAMDEALEREKSR